jgi:hypothetical protein
MNVEFVVKLIKVVIGSLKASVLLVEFQFPEEIKKLL